jgi:hypothetical protein
MKEASHPLLLLGRQRNGGAAIGFASIEVESPGLLLPGLTLEDMNLRVKQLLDLDFIGGTIPKNPRAACRGIS